MGYFLRICILRHLLESFFTPKPLGIRSNDLSELCYQIVIRRDFQIPEPKCFQGFPGFSLLFPLIFVVLPWLIYALIIIQNSNFEPVFLPVISFIKNFVAESVAKLLVEWCRVVVRFIIIVQ